MSFVQLDRQAPAVHQFAYRLTAAGLRGSPRIWDLVQRVRPLPANAAISVGGQRMPIDLSDKTTSINIYRGFYERAELAVLQHFVRPGDTCVDVGANAGLYSLAMRVLAGRDGQVIAFEPNPLMAAKVRALVEETDGADVEVVEVALGSEDGHATLHLFEGDSGLATLRSWNVTDGGTVEVELRRLDGVPEVADLPEIAFLKVDVESWEPEVLAGATGLFEQRSVRAALMELPTDSSAPVMADKVRELKGYQAFLIMFDRGRVRWRPALRPLALTEISAGVHEWSNMLLLRDDATEDARPMLSPN